MPFASTRNPCTEGFGETIIDPVLMSFVAVTNGSTSIFGLGGVVMPSPK